MRVLIDTNMLIRLLNPADAQHAVARQATNRLLLGGDELVLVSQTLYEFWVVATRPANQNGYGLSAAAATAELVSLHQQFTILDDTPQVRPEWERLVTTYGVVGKTGHDARFVAAMLVHGLTHILTFNVRHFARFPGITILEPAAVAAAGP
jgi:predicted nucleic acid-binding protein